MKRLLIVCIFLRLLFTDIALKAQNGILEIPYTENIDAFVNTNFLITGETLYYSVYCFRDEKHKPSTLSKLAYAELIDEKGESLLRQKVGLTNGKGAGDFFLPSTLPTGNYTLIVYTKWMRNFPLENFFQKQIVVINPYLRHFSAESEPQNRNPQKFRNTYNQKTNTIELVVSKKEYSKRQKVIVTVKNKDSNLSCNISLNVHYFDKEVDKVFRNSKSDSLNYVSENLRPKSQPEKKLISILPDLRGETISGIATESDTHKPIVNTDVFMSAPVEPFFFQVSQTDSSGKFYFNAKNIQSPMGLQFQMGWQSETKPFDITLDDEFINEYEKFRAAPLSIDNSLRKCIEQRNVFSQIDNAYFNVKSDSIIHASESPFFKMPDKVYNLDEFTRFPTMEDIFREYFYEVVLSKRDGHFVIQLTNQYNKDSPFHNSPMILVDGIRVFNVETLMNYNPLLIKSISLVTKQFVYGGTLFDGILSVTTYTGAAKDLPVLHVQKKHQPIQVTKRLYSPKYDSNTTLDRIPDYRIQLLWNPFIEIGPDQEFVFEFYTSDVAGDFLVELKGYNSNGEVIEVSDTIQVQK